MVSMSFLFLSWLLWRHQQAIQKPLGRRLVVLEGIAEIPIDEEVLDLTDKLISQGGIPSSAEADALHISVAAVHSIDYLLTWNFRHIDNAATKPIIHSICAAA